MKTSEVREGVKFHDDQLTSQPTQYRIHIVRRMFPDAFEAEHVASGTTRKFALDPAAIVGLRLIPPVKLIADLDDLVGEKVKIDLVDGGRLTGRLTAVRYHPIVIDGITGVEVAAIEIDRSGATSYPMKDIRILSRF